MSSSGKMTKGLSCNEDGTDYKIISDSVGKIAMITTNDSSLSIKGALKVGSMYKDVKTYEVSKYYEAGWGYVVDVGDNWKCVFWNDRIRNKRELEDSAAIAFFCQGK
jgi:hypothetical protein